MDNEYFKQEIVGEKEPEFISNLYKTAISLMAFAVYQKLDDKLNKLPKDQKPDYENMSVQDRASDVSDGIAMVLLPVITKLGAETKRLDQSKGEE